MKTISIEAIRKAKSTTQIIPVGMHRPIIQSIFDFDYLTGKSEPSIQVIVSDHEGFEKFFWGRGEVLVPLVLSVEDVSKYLPSGSDNGRWMLSLVSARRTAQVFKESVAHIDGLVGASLFAENITEQNAIQIRAIAEARDLLVVGPASVGLLVPGALKLGAVGGVDYTQFHDRYFSDSGSVAIVSGSGGMTNELISLVVKQEAGLSFALHYGGDRFPVMSPLDAFILAQEDQQTKTIVYYGELGGEDEYDIIKAIQAGKITKPIVAHIAGTVADLFPSSPQFGHAKAKADHNREKAVAKRAALRAAGCLVSDSYADFVKKIIGIKK